MICEIITGDCLDVLPRLDEPASLIIADPPYDIGLKYGPHCSDNLGDGEYRLWTRKWLEACASALTPDGSIFVIIDPKKAWFATAEAVDHCGLTLHQSLVWYESFGTCCSNKYGLCHRAMLWFCKKGAKPVFNREAASRPSDRQIKYADKRASKRGKTIDSVWLHLPELPPEDEQDIWRVNRVCGTFKERLDEAKIKGEKKRQLTQLPLKLIRPIVAAHSNCGDLVVDPFAGTGVSGVAAYELSRRFTGIELSPETADIGRRRVYAAQQQGLPA